jgi:glycosyltransferase involved in cell wall biosynthesis
MRVALPMLTLVPGISGGSETYARELTRALARVGRNDYEVLLPTIAADAGGGLPATVAEGYAASTTTAGRLLAMGAARVRPGRLRRSLTDAEVVHYPLTVRVPRVAAPTVITLLDVQHLDLPHLFSRGERLFRHFAYDRAARDAAHVIVISEFVRGRVIDRLGLAPDRVHAVWLGVDTTRFTPDPSVARERLLLYPARPWPHKNHARLFEAFALLRRESPDLRLVLTGAGHASATLPAGVEARSVTPDELIALYRRAACMVFPSLYEGFGLPPLEAMACGCPVAVSGSGSLPEICGDAAVLFDPLDPEAIAAGVDEALTRADELTAKGPGHAAAFTWDATARAHDSVYERAAGQRLDVD